MRRIPRSGTRRLHPVLLMLVVAFGVGSLASSCLEDTFGNIPEGAPTIFNATDETITIIDVNDGSVVSTLSPRETWFNNVCNDAFDGWVLEARLDDGTVVSTVPDTFCSVDPRWEITQAEVDATYPDGVIAIQNQSSQLLIVVAVTADGEKVYREIRHGRTVRDRSQCVEPDLEARLYDGTLVASRPGPFCQGDPMWVITVEEVDAAAG